MGRHPETTDAARRQAGEPPRPTVPNPCSVCGVPIFGSVIGTGDGTMRDGGSFAHPECYWRQQAKALLAEADELKRQWELEALHAANLRAEADRLRDALREIAVRPGEWCVKDTGPCNCPPCLAARALRAPEDGTAGGPTEEDA